MIFSYKLALSIQIYKAIHTYIIYKIIKLCYNINQCVYMCNSSRVNVLPHLISYHLHEELCIIFPSNNCISYEYQQTCEGMHAYLCMFIQRPEDNLGCHTQKLHSSPLRQDLSLSWSSPIRLDWLTSKSKDPPVSTSTVWGLEVHTTLCFYVYSDCGTQILMLTKQVVY